MNHKTPPEDDSSYEKNYTVAELAERLRVTTSFVRQKASKRQWPHLRFGPRTTVFTQQHYDEILEFSERTVVDPSGSLETTQQRNKRILKALGDKRYS